MKELILNFEGESRKRFLASAKPKRMTETAKQKEGHNDRI